MTWRRATAILLAAWVAVAGAIYLRDYGESPPPPTRTEAQFDARRVLVGITGGHCAAPCGVKILGQTTPRTWRVRLTAGAWQRCLDLDPGAFAYSPQSGFSGLKAAPCGI